MRRSLSLLALGFAVLGCGKSDPVSAPTEPMPKPSPEVILPPAGAKHEMDPAKHVVPASPATGSIGGKVFTPDRVTIEGTALTFRQGGDFFADMQITLYIAYKPNEAKKVTIKPSDKWHETTIPGVHISKKPRPEDLPKTDMVGDGYALTLDMAPRKDGKAAGTIYLSLPGGDFLAGTFEAVNERGLSDPPEPEDRPYIKGRVTHTGKPKQSLQFRYAGLPMSGGDPISDMVGSQLGEDGVSPVRSTTNAPRIASVRPGKMGGDEYDCTHLPPGKYFLIARLDDGPAGWKFVDVAADSALDIPLTVPAGPGGSLDVTVPGKATGQVQVIPSGLKLDDPLGTLTTSISGALNAYGNVADGKASVKNLAPGKYDVSLRTGTAVYRAEVTIESGKNAKAELK